MLLKRRVGDDLALFAVATVLSIFFMVVGTGVALAAEQSTFYQDKIVRIVVGAAPGGGFDVYARVLARHWGKYIPGNPQILVENQAGAATLLAAKNVFRAKPDGLTVGNFISDIALGRLLNQPGVDFDFQKFEWIGVPVRDNIVCALTKASGVTSIEKWKAAKTPVKLGGTGRLVITDNAALVLKHVVGLPTRVRLHGHRADSARGREW